MDFSRENVLHFLAYVAMYGFFLASPLWSALWRKWKDAKQKLSVWRECEVHIGSPNKEVEEFTEHEDYLGLIAPVLRHGFEPVGDYVVSIGYSVLESVSHAPLSLPHIAEYAKKFVSLRFDVSKIFEHKDYGCIAVVISMHNKNESTVNVQIISSGSGWTYSSDRQGENLHHLGMRQRDIESHHGRVSFRVLLEAHLLCRAEIARAGNFTWGEPPTADDVLHREEQYVQDVRDFARRHSPLSLLIWEYKQKRRKSGDWLGELEGKVTLPKSAV